MNRFQTRWLCCLLLLTGTPLHAQDTPRWRPQAGIGEVTFLGANTVLGALTGGITQVLRGGSFTDGFTRGALGGAIVYGGKRLSVEHFAGAGWMGREISAVGTSIVRNAGEGAPSLSRLILPVGPAWLYLHPGEPAPVNVKVDLSQLAWLAYAVAEPALSFDVGKTFSAGAPVFVARHRRIISDGEDAGGVTIPGTILLSGRGVSDEASTFAHERVHVIQRDFYAQAWFIPLESWILEKTPLRGASRYVDVNLGTGAYLTIRSALFAYRDRPEEIEASFLQIR